MHPLRRVGPKGSGRFSQISWDEALDEIAAKLQEIASEFGSEAILPYSYGGSLGYLNANGMDRRFFHRLGASRLDRTICASAGGTALSSVLGAKLGTEPEQFRDSKLILAWGANILSTNVHLWPFIVEARRNGAKFYTIDQLRQKVGDLADKHFPVQPGSDAALALGVIHVIIDEHLFDADYVARYTTGFEELARQAKLYTPHRVCELTGIPAHEIVALAREYAQTRPSVIRLNYGLQRSERGGLAVRLITFLPALTGAWRHPGGGLQLSTSGAFRLNTPSLERTDLQMLALGREARILNMSRLGEILTEVNDPPVKAIVVYCCNPATVAPDSNRVRRGLQREDLFTVVLEQFQTDTADFADIILPSTTFLEHTDLYFAYGHYYLQMARAALTAPGECRSNVSVFRELAHRMGFRDDCFSESEDDMIRGLLRSNHPFLQGVSFERLDREHFVRLNISEPGRPFLPFAEGNFETPSGKLDFSALPIEYTPPSESRLGDAALRKEFPLELVTPKQTDHMNSTFGYRDDAAAPQATLNPIDAEARSIEPGDCLELFNRRGSCVLTAAISDRVPPGVVSAPFGKWPRSSTSAVNVNTLTSQRLTDVGGGATFYSCLIEVRKKLPDKVETESL